MMKYIKIFVRDYKHGLLPIIYCIFYLIGFFCLENRQAVSFHMIHHPLDAKIPFCEYFIIPYYLWFPYIAVTVAAFVFIDKDKKDYFRLCFTLGFGMTFFLIFSYFYPNAIDLRPETIERSNLFVTLTKGIYAADTSTNVFPSIHCFDSLAVCAAVWHSDRCTAHRAVPVISTVLCFSIIVSTVFVKQHSVTDVIGAFVMFLLLYLPVYVFPHYREKSKDIPAGGHLQQKF